MEVRTARTLSPQQRAHLPSAVAKPIEEAGPYRVMVVDDSAVIRGFLTRYLQADREIEVIASASNGSMALSMLDRIPGIEAVVLDIEMPQMDGLTALPKLLERDKDLKVIMASTLTLKNADVSLRAIQMGAVDYVPKPESARDVNASTDFREELVGKVKAWCIARRRDLGQALAAPRAEPDAPAPLRIDRAPTAEIKLRTASTARPEILAIGSSTGGPQALLSVLAAMKDQISVPVVITQHMPAAFTAILADHIGKATGLPTAEAVDGAVLKPRQIYVAPGGYHLIIDQVGGQRVCRITEDPPENFCRPAVDPLFRSVAQHYGRHALSLILTGMGQDGMKGGYEIADAGGTVIAQDRESSVVWGMPGAAAQSGICAAVLPLAAIAGKVSGLLRGQGL